MTQLETLFMEEIKAEAYGGTLFTTDINPVGMTKYQKSAIVSNLVRKNILAVDVDYGQIGIIPEGKDSWDADWEINKELVAAAIERNV